ncbi:class I SAM-dependent methyltransferase [Hymenobacter cellulosivorans]|uniref:Class I SAM-dependent methyltransferase n=1 Tax=Hymenobacter cellulosivorans TaxID=2932249 RepID=A0ABY4FEE7_9BACT|nr:class I SAM-dependent methyltransferase [Hymenobacter cellulosivorans]UOQ54785.1 class I SAM-dependent methyltransferase [Hymenobacter cellulosivorans]
MTDTWTNRWNERYSAEAFAYGEQPNQYFQQQLDTLPAGQLLLPAEGEGRNAVYAATRGWQVSAFDISSAGQKKALHLAGTRGVTIDYQVGELEALQFTPGQFDALALIYAHFPASIKSAYHRQLSGYLRTGGLLIFEAFSKNHLAYLARNEKVGGPKDVESLFSLEEIRTDFAEYDFIELAETEIELTEGLYHNGLGSVIRCVARKK